MLTAIDYLLTIHSMYTHSSIFMLPLLPHAHSHLATWPSSFSSPPPHALSLSLSNNLSDYSLMKKRKDFSHSSLYCRKACFSTT